MPCLNERAKELATKRFRAAWIDAISICARTIVLTATLLAVTMPCAADASEAIIPHRALWPDTINSPAEFDRASRAEILVFAHELAGSEAFNEGALKDRLGIKAIDIAAVERLRHRLWNRLTENYVIASHGCVAGEAFCAGDTDPSDLREAAAALSGAGIQPRYRPWFDDAVRFQRSYLDELLRLAAVFPERNSEVETFNDNELTGWDLHDREFLLTFDDGPTHPPGDEAPDAGNTAVVAQYLRERGVDAATLATRYEGECDDAPEDVAPNTASGPGGAE